MSDNLAELETPPPPEGQAFNEDYPVRLDRVGVTLPHPNRKNAWQK